MLRNGIMVKRIHGRALTFLLLICLVSPQFSISPLKVESSKAPIISISPKSIPSASPHSPETTFISVAWKCPEGETYTVEVVLPKLIIEMDVWHPVDEFMADTTRFTIRGECSKPRHIHFDVPDGISGTFNVILRVKDSSGRVVLTKEVPITTDGGEPLGRITCDPKSLSLREMTLFYGSLTSLDKLLPVILVERKRLNIKGELNSAARNSLLTVKFVDENKTLLSSWCKEDKWERQAYVCAKKKPGEYKINVSLIKYIYFFSYDEERGAYISKSYRKVLLDSLIIPVTFVNVTDEFKGKINLISGKISIRNAKFSVTSKDNVYFDYKWSVTAEVELREMILHELGEDYRLYFPCVKAGRYTSCIDEIRSKFNMRVRALSPGFCQGGFCEEAESTPYGYRGRTWYAFIPYLTIPEGRWKGVEKKEIVRDEFPKLRFRVIRGVIQGEKSARTGLVLEEIAWLNRVRKLIFYTWLELQEPRWIVPYPIGPRETLPKRAIAVIARSGEFEVPFRYEPPFILVRGGNFKINNFAYRLHFEFREENEKPYWLFVFVSADGNITVRRALLKEKEWDFRDPAFFRIDVSGGGEEDHMCFEVKKILDENATEKTVDEILFSGEIKNGFTPRFTPLKRQVNETSGRFMFRDQWCILRFRSKEDLRRLSTLNFTFYIWDAFFDKAVCKKKVMVDVSKEIKRILSQVRNIPPEAKIKVSPEKPRPGEIVTVTSASKDPDGRIVKYKWIIYEDGEEIKEEENVTAVSFEVEAGKTYTVELTVVDDAGAKSADRITIIPYVTVSGQVIVEVETKINDDLSVEAAPLSTGTASISSFEITVKHGSLQRKLKKNPLEMEHLIFRDKNGRVITGTYFLIITGNYPPSLQSYFKAREAFKDARIKYEVEASKEGIKIYVIYTANCIIKTEKSDWSLVSPYLKNSPADVSSGFKIRIRPYAVWEELIRKTLIKFLSEAGVGEAEKLIHDFKIEYGHSQPQFIVTQGDLIYLPYPSNMFSLEYTRMGFSTSDTFGDFFEETGHYIRLQCFTDTGGLFNPKQWLINSFLYGKSHAIDKPFPALFIPILNKAIPIWSWSAFGAFDEGHTEFLRTLLIDYLKCQPYINITTPLPEKPKFYTSSNFYGFHNLPLGFTGNTVEGRVAGLLLAVLYWNDEDPRYHPDAERAVRAYKIFWGSVHSARMVIGRYPLIVDEVIYVALAKYLHEKTDMWELALYYMSPTKYNMPNSLRIRPFKMSGSTVMGKPILIYNLAPEIISPTARVYDGYTSYYLTAGDLIFLTAVDGSGVTSLGFPVKIVIYSHDGRVGASMTLRGSLGRVRFERRWVRVLNGEVHVNCIPGVGGGYTIKAGNVVVVPHSQFLLNVTDGKFTNLVTIEGNVTVQSNGTELNLRMGEGVKASPTGKLKVYKVDVSDIRRWWIIQRGAIKSGASACRAGDIDRDGQLTVADLVRVLRIAEGIEKSVISADLDGNGKVDMMDVHSLLDEILKENR